MARTVALLPALSARRVRARQGRSDLCWWLLGFAVFQLGLALAIERRLADVRDPEFAVKLDRLHALLAVSDARPLVVMLGSSRTRLGFQAGRLSHDPSRPALVFNGGMLGGGPMLELVCLRRLLADGIRPDLLLVEVTPMALSRYDGPPYEERWLDGARLDAAEFGLLTGYYHQPRRLFKKWLPARGVPARHYQSEFRQHLGLDRPNQPGSALSDHDGMDAHGWQVMRWEATDEQRDQYTRLALDQYGFTFNGFDLAPRTVGALVDTLRLARQHGMDVALVLMPEGSAFRTRWKSESESKLQALLHDLQRDHDAPLVDARDWVEDTGFWDGHHLLPAGAGTFTERLGREALDPLLRGLFSQRMQQRTSIDRGTVELR